MAPAFSVSISHGGALRRLATLARFSLGGTVGTSNQGISWIHQLDMNRLFARAIADDRMSGAYLATAPNPVSNAEFMRDLRRAHCHSTRLRHEGFEFVFPDIRSALADLYGPSGYQSAKLTR